MARWTHALSTHPLLTSGRYSCTEMVLGLAGLFMGLCSMMLVLGLCARRRQVGDRGSDGDGGSSNSPLKVGGGKGRSRRRREEEGDGSSGTGEVKNGSSKAGGKSNGSRRVEEAKNTINAHQQQQQQQQQEQQQQHQLRSPLWQHTILMGERCKRPTFSGLILYDDKGNPLPVRGHCPLAAPRSTTTNTTTK